MRFAQALLMLLSCTTQPAVDDTAGDDSTGLGSATSTDDTDLTVSMAPPARGYQLVTPSFEVPAHSEIEVCSVMRLAPDDGQLLAWVDRMESLTSPGTHHMNVVIGQFSFLDAFVGDGAAEEALGATVGQYPCADLPTMELGFPIFPSQRENQEITFPDGVAAPLTLPMVAVFSHHYVNTGAEPLTVNAVLNLETLPAEEVEHVASLLFDAIGDLEVPPGTRRTVSRTCVVDRDVDVALVSTHTHAWGECATMNHFDGPSGQVEAAPFYVNKQWDQPPILHFEPGSFSLSAGDGVHWACHYRNDTERTLTADGTAEGEMCVLAAVTWPSPWSVEQVVEIVEDQDLAKLITLLGDVMGPCDEVREDIAGPWSDQDGELADAGVCEDLPQTESNVLP